MATAQTSKPILTADQLSALQEYAEQHGRTWKRQLNDDWMTGRAYGELQQVRNTFGPSWLIRFKLPKTLLQASGLKRGVTSPAAQTKSNASILAWVVPEVLSDGSTGYNVVMDEIHTKRHVVIGAMGQEYAYRIAQAINEGAAWVELQS